MGFSGGIRKSVVSYAILIGGIIAIAIIINLIFEGRFLTSANINAICITAAITCFSAWGYCFIFAWSKIPSWIAGLGMCLIYEAAAAAYADAMQAKGDYVVLLKKEYSVFGHAPGVYIVFIIGIFVAYVLYNRSTFGLNVRSIGSNPAVAKAMSINITKTLIITGLVCGFFIGCAGFMRESYSLRVYAMTGLTSLATIFPPLATVFLAQVLSKWYNIILAVPFCALFIYICFNVLTIIGVPSGTLQEASLGLFVLIFGVIAQRGTKGIVK
jgi:ribose transport system permease protein